MLGRDSSPHDAAAPDASAIPRNVKVLSLVSLVNDASSEMLYPVLPTFLVTVLGAPIAAVGAIEGVANAMSSFMKIVSGRLADKRRRRPMVVAGYMLSGIAKPAIGFAQGWGLVLFSRVSDRFGKGIRTSPRDAIIASETPEASRGAAFGLHRAADSAGAVIGPLLGLVVYEMLDHQLRPMFFFAAIPAALTVALVFLVKEKRPSPIASIHAEERGPLSKEFWRTVALVATFEVLNFADAFLLLRARHLGFTVREVILVYVLMNLTYSVFSYPAGKLSDSLARRFVFGAGILVFAASYIGLGITRSASMVWLLIPLYGVFKGMTDGVGKAWITDLLPENLTGTGLGYFHGAVGFGALAASVWAGLAWNGSGEFPLLASGVGAVALALAVVTFGPSRRVAG